MKIMIGCELVPPPPDEWHIGYDFKGHRLFIQRNRDVFAELTEEETEHLFDEINKHAGRPTPVAPPRRSLWHRVFR